MEESRGRESERKNEIEGIGNCQMFVIPQWTKHITFIAKKNTKMKIKSLVQPRFGSYAQIKLIAVLLIPDDTLY